MPAGDAGPEPAFGREVSVTTHDPPPQLGWALPFAAPPDMIRSHQKDQYYRSALADQVQGVGRLVLGPRRLALVANQVKLVSDVAYYALTTLSGTRTLGEEYTDILPLDARTGLYPSALKRWAFVLLHLLLPYALVKGATGGSAGGRGRLGTWLDGRLGDWMSRFDRMGPIYKTLQRHWHDLLTQGLSLHLAAFYLSGAYQSLSKRILGLRYVLMRQLRPQEEPLDYSLLGYLLLVQVLVQTARAARRYLVRDKGKGKAVALEVDDLQSLLFASVSSNLPDLAGDLPGSAKCILCLESRTAPTSTPCGHLFCWDCIVECCRAKPECPLCRQAVSLPQLLPLSNYG